MKHPSTPEDLMSEMHAASQDVYEFDIKAEEVAEERGLCVVYPLMEQLQFDLDTEAAYEYFKKRLEDLEDCLDITHIEEHFSASGAPHRHVTLTLAKPIESEWERIALQAVMGSDPVREFLNARRILYGVENPTRFFEEKHFVPKHKPMYGADEIANPIGTVEEEQARLDNVAAMADPGLVSYQTWRIEQAKAKTQL